MRGQGNGIGLRGLAVALLLGHGVSATADFTPEAGGFDRNRALYEHHTGDHLAASLALLRSPEGDKPHALFTTHALLNYGLYNAAEDRFLGLLDAGLLTRAERAELYLKLARYAYERGYDAAADATLAAMEEDLGNYGYYERELLAALIAGRSGRLQESITRLDNRRVAGRSNFGKFNLAMALFAAGDIREARIKLDQIGRELVNDPLEHALRDRANLTLAYDYLREADGSAALPVLQRIRLDGPFSEEALLALGWAELSAIAPDSIRTRSQDTDDTIGGVLGTILRPGRVDEDLRRRLGMLRAREPGEETDLRYRRAIRAWQTLAQRDLRETPVLEVEVALPWALKELGEIDAARKYYHLGLKRLEVAAGRLESAMEAVRSGRMFETLIRADSQQYAGWAWRATELADADETWYLAQTLASTPFQEALKNYRDLRQLQRRLRQSIGEMERGAAGLLAASNADNLIRSQRGAQQQAVFPGLKPQLKMATELGRFPRNETLEGLLNWSYRFNPKQALDLTRGLARAPEALSASARPLVEEANALLVDIEQALPEQRALLESIAMEDLSAQREAIRKYQIEARFALARLYDVHNEDTDGDAQ